MRKAYLQIGSAVIAAAILCAGLTTNATTVRAAEAAVSYEFNALSDVDAAFDAQEQEAIKAKATVGNTDEEKLVNAANEQEEVIRKVISEMPELTSEYDKALYLHEYVVSQVRYASVDDGSNLDRSHTSWGALVEKKATCLGYSRAYMRLLERVGIESELVSYNAHTWNLVKIDGYWYHVDTTFADQYSVTGVVDHTFFLKSDAYYNADTKHSDGNQSSFLLRESKQPTNATSTKYDNDFTKEIKPSTISVTTDGYYYIKLTTLYKRDHNGKEVKIHDGASSKSLLWNNACNYRSTYLVNGRLYYNDNRRVYSIAIDGSEADAREETDQLVDEGNVFGFTMDGNQIRYAVSMKAEEDGFAEMYSEDKHLADLVDPSFDSQEQSAIKANGTGETDAEKLLTAVEEQNEAIDRIIKDMPALDTEYDKALYLHDYIVANVRWTGIDNAGGLDRCHTSWGALVRNEATDLGYSRAYMKLLQEVGIEAQVVTNSTHAWNLVKIDGSWYHVDTTFDDAYAIRGTVDHTYFLKSDAYIKADERYNVETKGEFFLRDSNEPTNATNTRYDNDFAKGIISSIVSYQDNYYYMDGTNLYKRDQSGEVKTILNGNTSEALKYYSGCSYRSLYLVNGRLYFNGQNKIYSIAVDGSETDAREETGQLVDGRTVFGFTLNGNEATFCLGYDVNEDQKVTLNF